MHASTRLSFGQLSATTSCAKTPLGKLRINAMESRIPTMVSLQQDRGLMVSVLIRFVGQDGMKLALRASRRLRMYPHRVNHRPLRERAGWKVENDRQGFLAVILAGRERKRAHDVTIEWSSCMRQIDHGHALTPQHFGEGGVFQQRDALAINSNLGIARHSNDHIPLELLLNFNIGQRLSLEGTSAPRSAGARGSK